MYQDLTKVKKQKQKPTNKPKIKKPKNPKLFCDLFTTLAFLPISHLLRAHHLMKTSGHAKARAVLKTLCQNPVKPLCIKNTQ